jgi:predicted porin
MMKKSLLCAAVLAAMSGAAFAQSASYGGATQTTVYGLVDLTVRYTTNATADGGSKVAIQDGELTGNRVGFTGVEDLGGGLKTVYLLEAGFTADTGFQQQGGRLFGRQGFVGLNSNSYGTLALGRMYTGTHNMVSSFDPFALANNSIIGPESPQYTGLRYDNMVKYVGRFGGLELIADQSATRNGQESPGAFAQNGGYDYAAAYNIAGFRIGASYGGQHAVNSYFGAPVAAQTQHVWSLGASYQFPGIQIMGYYLNAKLENSDIKNDVYRIGFKWQATQNGVVLGAWMRDKMKGYNGADGTRDDAALMFDYYLSKRTDVYIEGDYNHVADAWKTVATASSYGNYDGTNGPFFSNYPTRNQVLVGIRHMF